MRFKRFYKIRTLLCLWRAWGGYFLQYCCKKDYRQKMLAEQEYWARILKIDRQYSGFLLFAYLVRNYPEYVTLYRYRLKEYSIFLRIIAPVVLPFFPARTNLFISAETIGWNLFIQHGFSTIVGAKEIGENCWINQQVTVGYSFDDEPPLIGNGVRICAGAKVVGAVHLQDNVIVGANAVVVHDVAENEIVGGIPAKKIGMNTQHILYKG